MATAFETKLREMGYVIELEVFGEAGRHARSAIGVVVPLNYAVEIEMVVEVR